MPSCSSRQSREPRLTEISAQVMARLDELGEISETTEGLTRRYLTVEHHHANRLIAGWMTAAGMSTRIDAAGNVVGRYEGKRPGAPALLFGSHLDTVRNAGKYDGMLGVVAPIACVAALSERDERFDFAIEIVGFGDEEGTRFSSTLLGSRAVAGTFDPCLLRRTDADGKSLAEAIRAFGLDPTEIATAARRPDEILAYVELHIEQGPVLEAAGLPVGVVSSIAGAVRLSVTLTGTAGHAGTVPMALRRDALTAAAEIILAIERFCGETPSLVGTVGQIGVRPGAVNVIPGEVELTVDLRAPEDPLRMAALQALEQRIEAIAGSRGVDVTIEKTHESGACRCAPWLIEQLCTAIRGSGIDVRRLPSGAGHDAMAMEALADVAMLFVRCAGGISHNPAESIAQEDVGVAVEVLLAFIRAFHPFPAARRA